MIANSGCASSASRLGRGAIQPDLDHRSVIATTSSTAPSASLSGFLLRAAICALEHARDLLRGHLAAVGHSVDAIRKM